MRGDGPEADIEDVGDRLVRQPLRHEADDLLLAGAEVDVRGRGVGFRADERIIHAVQSHLQHDLLRGHALFDRCRRVVCMGEELPDQALYRLRRVVAVDCFIGEHRSPHARFHGGPPTSPTEVLGSHGRAGLSQAPRPSPVAWRRSRCGENNVDADAAPSWTCCHPHGHAHSESSGSAKNLIAKFRLAVLATKDKANFAYKLSLIMVTHISASTYGLHRIMRLHRAGRCPYPAVGQPRTVTISQEV